MLVGFDRGGWSPTLFAHMAAAGFDVLTWRKSPAADTTIDLPVEDGQVFTMRQITRAEAKNKHGHTKTRQIHILTTRTDLAAGEVIYRMGSRWRQENYFRYARMHFDPDSHDAYTTSDDDPTRSVPNPAKKPAHQQGQAARARYDRAP